MIKLTGIGDETIWVNPLYIVCMYREMLNTVDKSGKVNRGEVTVIQCVNSNPNDDQVLVKNHPDEIHKMMVANIKRSIEYEATP